MSAHICPWWLAYTFDNPLRRLVHRPEKVLGPYVREGMQVMDVGCGMGHFSLGMARMVGPGGLVISIDLQKEMLDILTRRALKAGLTERISTRLCGPDSLGVEEEADFILAFWMVHEAPDQGGLLAGLEKLLRPGGRLLVAEPKMHVRSGEFDKTLRAAEANGLEVIERPGVAFSHAAVFKRSEEMT
jgi:2-polyprenyl-3-methyl-5-hydroxy-6-metoxy-1,4-benzoquinol methylase